MIGYAFFSILTFGLLDNFRGPYFTQILNDLGVQDQVGALFFATTSGLASLSSAIGARWFRRFGTAMGLHQSAFCMAAGFALVGAAPNFYFVLFGAAIFGVGAGLGNFGQNVTVSELAGADHRASLLSGLHSMYGLASMAAPWLAHLFLEANISWRHSFFLVSLVPLCLLIGGLLIERHRRWPKPMPTSHQPFSPLTPGQRQHVAVLSVAIAVYLLAEISVGTRLVRWLEVDRGFSAASGALYLAGFFGALLTGRLFSWWKAPQTKLGLQRALLGLSIAGCVALTLTLTIWPALVVLVGVILGPFYPLAIAYLRFRFGAQAPRALATALGIGSLTVLLMHLSLGLVSGFYGQSAAMLLGPAGLFIGAALLLFEAKRKW